MIIEFEGIRFAVRRVPRKRNISISLRPNGSARISAGMGCPTSVLEGFLEEKRDWIRSISQKFVSLREAHPKLIIRDGAEVPLLGEKHRVLLQNTDRKTITLKVVERNFIVQLPKTDQKIESPTIQEKLRHTLRKHYRNLAAELLARRTEHWVRVTGLAPQRLSFRGQKTRWGSCSPTGAISLNWKLICAEPSVIDYVIIHELCHLKHLNHSLNFWRLVESYCPNWKEKKKWLQSRSFDFDFLNQASELHEE